jgi:hypothetical protein
MNGNNYTYITTAATTVIGAPAPGARRITLCGLSINTATAGIVTVKSGSTAIATFAAATAPGTYLLSMYGIEVQDLQITNASAEDITVIWNSL